MSVHEASFCAYGSCGTTTNARQTHAQEQTKKNTTTTTQHNKPKKKNSGPQHLTATIPAVAPVSTKPRTRTTVARRTAAAVQPIRSAGTQQPPLAWHSRPATVRRLPSLGGRRPLSVPSETVPRRTAATNSLAYTVPPPLFHRTSQSPSPASTTPTPPRPPTPIPRAPPPPQKKTYTRVVQYPQALGHKPRRRCERQERRLCLGARRRVSALVQLLAQPLHAGQAVGAAAEAIGRRAGRRRTDAGTAAAAAATTRHGGHGGKERVEKGGGSTPAGRRPSRQAAESNQEQKEGKTPTSQPRKRHPQPQTPAANDDGTWTQAAGDSTRRSAARRQRTAAAADGNDSGKDTASQPPLESDCLSTPAAHKKKKKRNRPGGVTLSETSPAASLQCPTPPEQTRCQHPHAAAGGGGECAVRPGDRATGAAPASTRGRKYNTAKALPRPSTRLLPWLWPPTTTWPVVCRGTDTVPEWAERAVR